MGGFIPPMANMRMRMNMGMVKMSTLRSSMLRTNTRQERLKVRGDKKRSISKARGEKGDRISKARGDKRGKIKEARALRKRKIDSAKSWARGKEGKAIKNAEQQISAVPKEAQSTTSAIVDKLKYRISIVKAAEKEGVKQTRKDFRDTKKTARSTFRDTKKTARSTFRDTKKTARREIRPTTENTRLQGDQRPQAPEAAKPQAPEAAKPQAPEAAKPQAPEAAKPQAPEAAKPQAPEAAKPQAPEAAKPQAPEAAKPETEPRRPTSDEVTIARTWKEAWEPVEKIVEAGDKTRAKLQGELKALDPYQSGLSPKEQLKQQRQYAQKLREQAHFERGQAEKEGKAIRGAFDKIAVENDIDAGTRNKDASKADRAALAQADAFASEKDLVERIQTARPALFPQDSSSQLPRTESTPQGQQGLANGGMKDLADALRDGKLMEALAKEHATNNLGPQRRHDTDTARNYRAQGMEQELNRINAGETRAKNLEDQASNMVKEVTRTEGLIVQKAMVRAMVISNVVGNLNNTAGQLTGMAGAIGRQAATIG